MSRIQIDLEKRRMFCIGVPLTLAEKQAIVKAAMDRGQVPAVFARNVLLELVMPKETAA